MGEIVRFLWNASRGSRWRPWRHPYLRWRLETYSGKPAGEIRASDFFKLAWNEKRQFLRFLRWVTEMKRYASEAKPR